LNATLRPSTTVQKPSNKPSFQSRALNQTIARQPFSTKKKTRGPNFAQTLNQSILQPFDSSVFSAIFFYLDSKQKSENDIAPPKIIEFESLKEDLKTLTCNRNKILPVTKSKDFIIIDYTINQESDEISSTVNQFEQLNQVYHISCSENHFLIYGLNGDRQIVLIKRSNSNEINQIQFPDDLRYIGLESGK
jgi:hypothetical protein